MGSCAQTSACTDWHCSHPRSPGKTFCLVEWLARSPEVMCNVSPIVLENQSDASLWSDEKAENRGYLGRVSWFLYAASREGNDLGGFYAPDPPLNRKLTLSK